MYSKNDRVFAKFYRCFQKTKGCLHFVLKWFIFAI
jgi:hypothetical protein